MYLVCDIYRLVFVMLLLRWNRSSLPFPLNEADSRFDFEGEGSNVAQWEFVHQHGEVWRCNQALDPGNTVPWIRQGLHYEHSI